MTSIGSLQGTYLGIYPGSVCEFWTRDARANCHFCSVGLNLGADDAREKTIADILEVVRARRARRSKITYVDLNAGHRRRTRGSSTSSEPIVARIKRETGLLVGIQAPPHSDLSRYDRLREVGLNRVSFCFELFRSRLLRAGLPGKAKTYGLDRYLAAIEYCTGLARRRAALEPWVVNGELIAGLRGRRSRRSPRSIGSWARRGADGVRVPASARHRLRGRPAPDTDSLVPVFPPSLRGVRAARASDRPRPKRSREPCVASGGMPIFQRRPRPASLVEPEARPPLDRRACRLWWIRK